MFANRRKRHHGSTRSGSVKSQNNKNTDTSSVISNNNSRNTVLEKEIKDEEVEFDIKKLKSSSFLLGKHMDEQILEQNKIRSHKLIQQIQERVKKYIPEYPDTLVKQRKTLEKEIVNLNYQIKYLKFQLESVTLRRNEKNYLVEVELQDKEEVIKKLEVQNKYLSDELETIKQKINVMNEENEKIRNQLIISQQNQDSINLKRKLESVNEKVLELQIELNQININYNLLKAELDNKEKIINEQEKQFELNIQNKNAEIDKLIQTNLQLEKQLVENNNEQKSQSADIILKDYQELKAKYEKQEKEYYSLLEKGNQNIKIQNQNMILKEQNLNLENKINKINQLNESLKDKLDLFDDKTNEWVTCFNDKQFTSIGQLWDKYEFNKNEIFKKELQIEQNQILIQGKDNQNQELRQKIMELEQQNLNADSKCDELNSQIEFHKQQNSLLNNTIEEQKLLLDKYYKELDELKNKT